MNQSPDNYNLLVKSWIPVLRINGKPDRVGIRRALTEAGSIRQIAASNPMDNVALFRLLLAVLQWCKPSLSDADRQELEGADGILDDWLRERLGMADRPSAVFNLLGNGHRFMQAPRSAHNQRPVADLFHELPGASNVAHLRHIKDYRDGACPACIAIGLARLPTAITGKGSGKHPGINGDPPVYFVPVGETLMQTLLLNWPFPHLIRDQPCWVRAPFTRDPEGPVGTMEGFTWTSRQFAIDDTSIRSGSCLVCGTPTIVLVTRLYELNKPNGREGLSRAREWRDPHLAYAKKGKNLRAEDTERNPVRAAGQWREWVKALTQIDTESGKPPAAVIEAARRINEKSLGILAVGLATRQSDKYLESLERSFAIPTSLLIADTRYGFTRQIARLDETVERLLDPRTSSWTKPIRKLKDANLLTSLAAHDSQKLHALRSALADRLPTLELAMFTTAKQHVSQSAPGSLRLSIVTRDWNAVLGAAVMATTPGSALRRREATERARQVLASEIAKLAKTERKEGEPENKQKRKSSKKKRGAR